MAIDEKLNQIWTELKQTARGHISLHQEGIGNISKEDYYNPFQTRQFGREYDQIWSYLNGCFGSEINDDNRGKGEVYVELREEKERSGRLLCYGCAHRDSAGRPNFHYFVVQGNYPQLKETFSALQKDPTKIRNFVGVVFSWENVLKNTTGPGFCSINQFDVISEMKKAYFLDTGKGYGWWKRYKIKKEKHNPKVVCVNINN